MWGFPLNTGRLFRQIIGELQLRRPCFEEFPPHYLRLLLAEIHRSQKDRYPVAFGPNQEGILRAVQDFNESFAAPISIQEYAASRHMSVCWFIRSFRNYMGMAPMQYITFLRITRAKELASKHGLFRFRRSVLSSDMKILSISAGYLKSRPDIPLRNTGLPDKLQIM